MTKAHESANFIEITEGQEETIEAAEENKLIKDKVEATNKELEKIIFEEHENENEYKIVENKYKSFYEKLKIIKHMLLATKRQLDDDQREKEKLKLQKERLTKDNKEIDENIQEIREQINRFKNEISLNRNRLKSLEANEEYDAEKISAWLEEYKKRDTDARLLKKYTYQDETLMKELEINLKKASSKLVEVKAKNEEQYCELISAQNELDSSAIDYRKNCVERRTLICQWSHLIDHMRSQDQAMDKATTEMVLLTANNVEVKNRLTLKIEELNNSVHSNVELINNTVEKSKELAQLVEQKNFQMEQEENLNSELRIMKNSLLNMNMQLEKTRAENRNWKKEIKRFSEKTNNVREICKILTAELEECKKKVASETEIVDELDKKYLRKNEELEKINLMRKNLSDERRRLSIKLEDLKNQYKLIENQISSRKIEIRQLGMRQAKCNLNSKTDLKIFFEQDFKILSVNRRIERILGRNVPRDESKKLYETFVQLQNQMLRKKKERRTIDNEVVEIKAELHSIKIDTENIRLKLLEYSKEEKKELTVHQMLASSLQKNYVKKQEMIIESNLLEFRLNMMKDKFNEVSTNVLDLDTQKAAIEAANQSKILEVNALLEQAKLQYRLAYIEKRKISAELNERLVQVEKVKLRYEDAILPLQDTSEFDEKSTLNYFIKKMTEHQELKMKGSNLNAELEKCSRETVALRNTLEIINKRQAQQRAQIFLKKPNIDVDEASLHDQLTIDKFESEKRKRILTKKIKEAEDMLLKSLNDQSQLDKELSYLTEMYENREVTYNSLIKEIKNYGEMIQRSDNLIFPLKKEKSTDCDSAWIQML